MCFAAYRNLPHLVRARIVWADQKLQLWLDLDHSGLRIWCGKGRPPRPRTAPRPPARWRHGRRPRLRTPERRRSSLEARRGLRSRPPLGSRQGPAVSVRCLSGRPLPELRADQARRRAAQAAQLGLLWGHCLHGLLRRLARRLLPHVGQPGGRRRLRGHSVPRGGRRGAAAAVEHRPPAPPEDGAPSACLDRRKARARSPAPRSAASAAWRRGGAPAPPERRLSPLAR